jgi:hypothetical protein
MRKKISKAQLGKTACLAGAFAGVLAAGLSWAPSVSASSPKVKEVFVERQMVMPKSTLRIDSGERYPLDDGTMYDGSFKHSVLRGRADEQYLNPGISFGLVKDFELGLVAPLRLSPSFRVEDPRVHALFQFLEGEVEAGVFGGLRLGFRDVTVLSAGVPVFWHINPKVRLETGGFLRLEFGKGSSVGVVTPIQVVFQPTRQLFAGPESGLDMQHLFDDQWHLAIPLGGFVGYSLTTSGGTLGDVFARLRLHDLTNGFDRVDLMAGLEFFFDL